MGAVAHPALAQLGGAGGIVHGTCVAHGGQGLLILGASGRGKSGLALRMIALGAMLVSDDRTCLAPGDAGPVASAPPAIAGRIEARHVGLLRLPVAPPTPLALLVDLDATEAERLPPARHACVMGHLIPLLRGAEGAHFPASLLLSLAHGLSAP